MTVKHIPTKKIHKGSKGGGTGCGFNTQKVSNHELSSPEKITCSKNGCKYYCLEVKLDFKVSLGWIRALMLV